MKAFTTSLLGLILFFSTAEVGALEVYSLATAQCRLHQGVIVHAEDGDIDLVDITGKLSRVRQSEVQTVIVHTVVENPITNMQLDQTLIKNLRQVYGEGSDKPLFIGWPVKFIENLVVFYDIEGKSHVLELHKIDKLRPEMRATEKIHPRGREMAFHLGDYGSECGNIRGANDGIRPTRIMSDKIQISEFFSTLEKGYRKVAAYEERTYLYARPVLYEKASKLGIVVSGSKVEDLAPALPMYFQWSSGEAYGFQSFNQVGSIMTERASNVDPVFGIRSDLKSHFFHANFYGNIAALSAGTEYFSSIVRGGYYKGRPIAAASSLNYMALLGGDYGPWSASIGTYYPTFLIKVNDEMREVLANSYSPIFELMYTRAHWRARGIISAQTRNSSDVDDLQISVGEKSVLGVVQSYSFESQFIRGGIDYDISDNITTSLDQIYLRGKYSEVAAGPVNNQMEFTHITTSGMISHRFGEYVSLKAYMSLVNQDEKYSFSGSAGKRLTNDTVTGGVFEFIF